MAGSELRFSVVSAMFAQRMETVQTPAESEQVILDLRVALLSGVWNEVYREVLKTHTVVKLATPEKEAELPVQIAC
jgi:hypothetical protein